ncbi:sodium:solute symporter family protein [Rhodovastum atsumiense]|uniref:Sodium:solute symporter family protein n=2 Tax=Rhodovastum atsumiense TaxID=504468 RepID=A0A5M6J3L3_9PROT|nr:sodium:solute symporter family protein [Rhodovastum atsumiense]
MTALTNVHLLSLVATLAVILAITAWSARATTSAEGFSLCGRSAGPLLIAGGIAGTCIGGSATVGTAQMGFAIGLSGWWFTLGMGLGLVLMALCYAAPLRRSGLETVPEFLGLQYGRTARPLTSVISSLGILFSMVASGLSGIALIALLLHLTDWQAAGIIILLVAICVCFGGMKGAGVSGLLKMAVIWTTLCAAGVIAALSLARMPDFDATFPAWPWFSLLGRGTADCMGNLVALIVGTLCTQTYIQAVYSATNARVAAMGAMVAALITIPVGLPSVAIGMFMHAAHPDINPILALPMYLTLYLPPWLGGIGLAAILLSVVGSIAGLALGIGTMVARDIGAGVLRITADRWSLLLNRLAVLLATCLAVAIALANADTYVLDWNYMSMALRGAGIFLPLTLAIFWPRHLPGNWALLSMAASTVAAVVARFVLRLPVNPLFVGMAVSLIAIGMALLATGLRAARADNGKPA